MQSYTWTQIYHCARGRNLLPNSFNLLPYCTWRSGGISQMALEIQWICSWCAARSLGTIRYYISATQKQRMSNPISHRREYSRPDASCGSAVNVEPLSPPRMKEIWERRKRGGRESEGERERQTYMLPIRQISYFYSCKHCQVHYTARGEEQEVEVCSRHSAEALRATSLYFTQHRAQACLLVQCNANSNLSVSLPSRPP